MDAPGATDRAAIIAAVTKFVADSMRGDPASDNLLAPGFVLTFTGGRRFASPAEVGAFNARRYRHVAKRILRWDVADAVAEDGAAELVVTCTGHLHGAWPDGTPFDGNRFLDRFVLRGGPGAWRIVRMDVWNDSAEWILDGNRGAPPG